MTFKAALASALLLASGSAMAADLPVRKGAPAPAPLAMSWTGAYVGVAAGYSFLSEKTARDLNGQNPSPYADVNGFLVGGQLGFDYQINSVVVGLSADLAKSFASKSFPQGPGANLKIEDDYVGTARARVGVLLTPKFLAYATGGFAMAKSTATYTDVGTRVSESKTATGYVLGLGAEYRYTRNVSSFIEYRYYNYLKATFTRLNGIVDSSNSEIRVGVLYRF
jgi:outer membrane immunogenic protein